MKALIPSFASISDDELIAQVVNRSEEALEELYRRHHSILRTIIMRVMNNEVECDDVLQDVFIQLWDQAAKYSPEKGNLKAWLITLARRRSLDRLRKKAAYQKATSRFELEIKPPVTAWTDSSAVDDEVRHNELHKLLEGLIDSHLPKEQGEAVRLTYFQGLSQRQIAARLSLPLGTVKTRIELGMRKLSRSALIAQAA